VTPHGLRHTAASLAIGEGANVKLVQRMLGHASAAMTLDAYADLFDSDHGDLADRLDPRSGSAQAPQQPNGARFRHRSRIECGLKSLLVPSRARVDVLRDPLTSTNVL
jgi:hypothetical protein